MGYLADDVATIRIPMGILTSLVGSDSSFKWDFTHQRAFDEVKRLVQTHRDHHRVPLDYSPGAAPIWLVTDGSHGGIAGVVCQGESWRDGRVAIGSLYKVEGRCEGSGIVIECLLQGVIGRRKSVEITAALI